VLRGKTVFVVGAGASKEFDLPVGAELAIKINEKLNVVFDEWGQKIITGDADLFQNVVRSSKKDSNPNAWQKAAWIIRDGIVLAHSIDDFLDAHQHNWRVVEYGKAAIAKCILEEERTSTLYFNPNEEPRIPGRSPTIDIKKNNNNWLTGLMRLLVRRTPYAERARILDQCSFVVFNYDRCIEHFFFHAFQNFYDVGPDESADIVNRARIYHPYGMAGLLGSIGAAGNRAPFGASRADYYTIGNTALKTYTESVESSEIQTAMLEAEKIVFLGFAYHDQNMDVLARLETMDVKPIIGTALQMSDSDVEVTRQQIGGWAKEGVHSRMIDHVDLRDNLKAADIFTFYSKSL
jgi:hypothetical protein